MEEIWKDVPGFEGLYQASTEGNIRSLNYNGEKGRVQNLKPRKYGKGNYYKYYRVQLSNKAKNIKKKEYQWGKIIALTFIPNPENKPLVKYIDANATNNKPSNLKWATHKEVAIENIVDKKIIYNGKSFKTEKELAEYYGISPNVFGKRKQCGWTLEEILTIPVDKKNACGKPYYYNYNGKSKTLKQISEEAGIKLNTIYYRIYAGWDIYSTAEIPANKYKNRREKANA